MFFYKVFQVLDGHPVIHFIDTDPTFGRNNGYQRSPEEALQDYIDAQARLRAEYRSRARVCEVNIGMATDLYNSPEERELVAEPPVKMREMTAEEREHYRSYLYKLGLPTGQHLCDVIGKEVLINPDRE